MRRLRASYLIIGFDLPTAFFARPRVFIEGKGEYQ